MTRATPDNRESPVFIIGHHRSGTTILYNVLAETGRFSFPTPFHIVYFDEHLSNADFDSGKAFAALADRFDKDGITDRFIDDIAAGPSTPEEYGFVLPGGQISPTTESRFRAFCHWVRADYPGDACLLLKNPRDIPNILSIRDAFPDARFIFLHRHPGPAIASRLKELRDLFTGYSRYQAIIEPAYARMGGIRRGAIRFALGLERAVTLFLLWEFKKNGNDLLVAIKRLPEDSYLSLTYEELCAQPEGTLERIFDFLGLDARDLGDAAGRIKRKPAGRSRNAILMAKWSESILQRYLSACGYRGMWPD